MITVLVHIANQEPIKLDLEGMPSADDQVLVGKNPRERTEREVSWLEDGVVTVAFPWHRINFIEVLPSEEDADEFPLPFRE
jgi:hypothetical protein